MEKEFQENFLEKQGLTLSDPVWSLVKSLEVTQEMADHAVETRFPGYAFAWMQGGLSPEKEFLAFLDDAAFLTDPALTLGILARTHGKFYQSRRSPDYSIGHLLSVHPVFIDNRLPGEPSSPLWHWKAPLAAPAKTE